MNREQKIALILGFAVILVVGVLVSDHWSRARELELADAAEGDAAVLQQAPVALLPGPGEVIHTPYVPREERPALALAQEVEEPTAPPSAEPEDVVTIAQGSGESDSPLGEALSPSGTQDNWLSRFESLAQRAGQGLPEALRLDGRSPERSVSPPPVVFGPPAREPEARPEPQRTRHTVAKNESLFAIAKRYYGDGNQWRRIAEANASKVGKDGGVRQGVTLEIPGIDGPALREAAAPARADGAARPTTYTVKRNDSLSEISQRLLGSSKRMRDIIAANRGTIDDPDDIRVGMVLTIPAGS